MMIDSNFNLEPCYSFARRWQTNYVMLGCVSLSKWKAPETEAEAEANAETENENEKCKFKRAVQADFGNSQKLPRRSK